MGETGDGGEIEAIAEVMFLSRLKGEGSWCQKYLQNIYPYKYRYNLIKVLNFFFFSISFPLKVSI